MAGRDLRIKFLSRERRTIRLAFSLLAIEGKSALIFTESGNILLHVERQWLNVGNRAHSPDAAHHLSLDILEGFALRLRHVRYHKH